MKMIIVQIKYAVVRITHTVQVDFRIIFNYAK